MRRHKNDISGVEREKERKRARYVRKEKSTRRQRHTLHTCDAFDVCHRSTPCNATRRGVDYDDHSPPLLLLLATLGLLALLLLVTLLVPALVHLLEQAQAGLLQLVDLGSDRLCLETLLASLALG